MPYLGAGCRGYVHYVDRTIVHDGPEWPYLQLAAALRRLIAGMQPDQRLPSVKHLCQEFGVSEKTAAKALRLLADEGLVYTRASRGTYVKRH
jgi:GntR family transcriptional regulator